MNAQQDASIATADTPAAPARGPLDWDPSCPIGRPISRYHQLVALALGLYSLLVILTMALTLRQGLPDPWTHPLRMYALWPLGALALPWALVETARYLARRSAHRQERLKTWLIAAAFLPVWLTIPWLGRTTLYDYWEVKTSASPALRRILGEWMVVFYPYRGENANAMVYRGSTDTNLIAADDEYIYSVLLPAEIPSVCIVSRAPRRQLLPTETIAEKVAALPPLSLPRPHVFFVYGQWYRPFLEGACLAGYLAVLIFLVLPAIGAQPAPRRRLAALVAALATAALLLVPWLFGFRLFVDGAYRIVSGVLYDFAAFAVARPYLYPVVADVLILTLTAFLFWCAVWDRFWLYVREQRKPIGLWELEGE